MTTWSPLRVLQPAEWVVVPSQLSGPVAVIRRFRFGPGAGEEWFRAVTWSRASDDRELIGWAKTLEAAASASWDWWCAVESWRHGVVGKRRHGEGMVRPPAEDLLREYRDGKVADG